MDGAAERAKAERALVWWGAMMPHMKKPPSFDEFVQPSRKPKRQDPETLEAMFMALARAWGATEVMQ
jgi:hypothetical protein